MKLRYVALGVILMAVSPGLVLGQEVGLGELDPAATTDWNTVASTIFPTGLTRLGVGVGRTEGFGARALGMGGAFTAVADDATAALWNPAGLAQLAEMQINLGASYRKSDVDRAINASSIYPTGFGSEFYMNRSEASKSGDSGFAPSFLSFSIPVPVGNNQLAFGISTVQDQTFDEELSFEIGDATGQTLVGYSDPDGRLSNPIQEAQLSWAYQGTGAYEVRQSGELRSLNLTAAYNVGNVFLAGLTLSRVEGTQDLTTTTRFAGVVEGQRFSGELVGSSNPFNYAMTETWNADLSGWSATIGILGRPSPIVDVAAFYKTKTDLDYEYAIQNAVAGQYTAAGDEAALYQPWTGTSSLELPSVYGFGVALHPAEGWTIAFDASRSEWEDATVYIEGLGDVYYPSLLPADHNPDSVEQFTDTTYRLGGEYATPAGNTWLLFRLGGYYEEAASGIPGQDQPTITGYTAGFGLQSGRFTLDLALVFDSTEIDIKPVEDYLSYYRYYTFGAPNPEDPSGFQSSTELTNLEDGSFVRDTFRAMVTLGWKF